MCITPVEACDTLQPRHVGTQSLGAKEAPYYLVQSSNSYGDGYDGRVKGIKDYIYTHSLAARLYKLHIVCRKFFPKESLYNLFGLKMELGGELFKGFMIVAIDPLTGKRIGNWIKFKGTDILPCSAITHTNSRPKRMASLIWVPDPGARGYVAFEATIVRSFSEYYSGLGSVLPHQQSIREKSAQSLSKS
ncbi:unnamed protein product [Medioppia subpectinata]|uniref:Reelin domain-containing protein n=1 Tax=Medioppia subpectinata TaxID=1979941 RepID=A0A7R9KRA4_9ACAR|nr:unnamed protein product [Medioppia subpectinata]CAG2107257.1 unnamed protein product [Medioppia subpectinata]